MKGTDMTTTLSDERGDLLETLGQHRSFLRFTVRGLSDEQLALRTTVSELCLGSVLKHVAAVEQGWANFIAVGPSALGSFDEVGIAAHHEQFQLSEDDTLESLLAAYELVAAATDELVSNLPSVDASHPLPEAPWFEAGGALACQASVAAHPRRDRPARRSRRHHPRDYRWRENHGVTIPSAGHHPSSISFRRSVSVDDGVPNGSVARSACGTDSSS
jgi:hypothetical protein